MTTRKRRRRSRWKRGRSGGGDSVKHDLVIHLTQGCSAEEEVEEQEEQEAE
jgi:hypothetical protein